MFDVQELFDSGFAEFFALPIFFKVNIQEGHPQQPSTICSRAHRASSSNTAGLSAVIELTCRLITSTLLETYLGADVGRGLLGQVKRGTVKMRSAIWFSDIEASPA